MDKLRVGFVGAGFMGQLAHLTNFVELKQCEVVALAETREQLREQVARKYGIPKTVPSHLDLCEDPDIDAVVEITSDDMHAPIAIDAMNAGKHVFMEKPMATCLKDAQEMVDAARRNNVHLVIGYMKRYDPGVEQAREMIQELKESGELGGITFARAHCFGGDWVCNVGTPIRTDEPYPDITPHLPDWLDPKDAGKFKGFNNVYCHNFNLLRFLAGDISDVRFADLNSPTNVVVLAMDDFSAALELGHLSANAWDEQTKLYFADGWIEVRTPSPLLKNVPATVELYKAGKIQEVLSPYTPWEWSFRRADEQFINDILNDEASRSSGEDSLKDMAVIEEIFKRCYNFVVL